MPDRQDSWALTSALKVAEAIDWIRRRMNQHGKGLIIVAIGENSVCFAKDPKLSSAQAAQILMRNVDNIQRGFDRIKVEGVTRGFTQREDNDGTE